MFSIIYCPPFPRSIPLNAHCTHSVVWGRGPIHRSCQIKFPVLSVLFSRPNDEIFTQFLRRIHQMELMSVALINVQPEDRLFLKQIFMPVSMRLFAFASLSVCSPVFMYLPSSTCMPHLECLSVSLILSHSSFQFRLGAVHKVHHAIFANFHLPSPVTLCQTSRDPRKYVTHLGPPDF